MVHEDLQRDVVREEEVGRRALVLRVVRDRRVELREQEARLRAILVALDVHRHREALGEEDGRVLLWRGEQLPEVLVLGVLVVALLPPGGDRLAVEDDDLDIEDEIELQEEEEDEKRASDGEKSQTLLPPRFPRSTNTPTIPRETTLARRLDNPSIQLYPQEPEQVKLDAVQKLADVFESVYSSQSSSGSESSTSMTPLAARPRPSYKRFR